MTKLLLYAIIFGTTTTSLIQPWIGVLAYYTLALLRPQAVWSWIFGDLRVTFYVSLATILGFVVASQSGRLDFSILKDKQNLYLIILWVAIIVSYFFNPYGVNESAYEATNSKLLITVTNKIFFFYFISIILIDDKKKFHLLITVFLVTICFYIYFANKQYFMGEMVGPRLGGPGWTGVYSDENAYAMLFVMGVPFLYFIGSYYKNKFLKYLLWGLIPFGWHAIFLTGSRGGLVGIGVVSLFIAIRSKSKLLGMAILVAMVFAFSWQGGNYMKNRAKTIFSHEEEGSISGRLDAWSAGLKMIKDYPLSGVGPGNFMPAFPDYSDKKPRVSHNTVLQLTSESGILAGLMYLLLYLNIFLRYWKQRNLLHTDSFFHATNEAIVGSLVGFFACSLFLNLAIYETFYYMLILSIVQNKLISNNQLTS